MAGAPRRTRCPGCAPWAGSATDVGRHACQRRPRAGARRWDARRGVSRGIHICRSPVGGGASDAYAPTLRAGRPGHPPSPAAQPPRGGSPSPSRAARGSEVAGGARGKGLAGADVAAQHLDRRVAAHALDQMLGRAGLRGAGDKAGPQRMGGERRLADAGDEDMAHARCLEAAVEQAAALADRAEQRPVAKAGGREVGLQRGGSTERIGAAGNGDRLARGASLGVAEIEQEPGGADLDARAAADVEADQLGAAQGGEEADEQQRPVAQGARVRAVDARDEGLQGIEIERRGAADRAAHRAGDAGEDRGDGGALPVEGLPRLAMRVGDGGQRPLDGGQRLAGAGQLGEVGGDRLRRGGQRRGMQERAPCLPALKSAGVDAPRPGGAGGVDVGPRPLAGEVERPVHLRLELVRKRRVHAIPHEKRAFHE